MRLEAQVDSAVVAYAKRCGLYSIKLTMLGIYGSGGWPDRLFLGPERLCFFVEMKKPGGKCTPLQKTRHQLLRKLGFSVYVVDNPKLGREVIDLEMERNKCLEEHVGVVNISRRTSLPRAMVSKGSVGRTRLSPSLFRAGAVSQSSSDSSRPSNRRTGAGSTRRRSTLRAR